MICVAAISKQDLYADTLLEKSPQVVCRRVRDQKRSISNKIHTRSASKNNIKQTVEFSRGRGKKQASTKLSIADVCLGSRGGGSGSRNNNSRSSTSRRHIEVTAMPEK